MTDIVGNKKIAVALWSRLVRIHQLVDRASTELFRSEGLSPAWFDVLARVRSRPGLTQQELAEALLVTKGNISQVLDRMTDAGLVERRSDGHLRRIHLTPRAREIADRIVPRQEQHLSERLSCLTAEEKKELLRLLRKWEKP